MIWRRALPYHATKRFFANGFKQEDLPTMKWVSGSVAILRTNKQIYGEALPILYGEETFTVLVQPRRAFLKFSPADPELCPNFGLVTSNIGVDTRKHPGLALVKKWVVSFRYHSVRGASKKVLKCSGLQSFLNMIPPTPIELILGVLEKGKPNSDFVWSQMVWAFVAAKVRTSRHRSENVDLTSEFWNDIAAFVALTS